MVGVANSFEGYAADRTIFLWSKNTKTRKVVKAIGFRYGFTIFDATNSSNSETDLLAVPCFICVVDLSWYRIHQNKIVKYHQLEAHNAIEIVIGKIPIRLQSSKLLINMRTAEFNQLIKIFFREKSRFNKRVNLLGL